ncbi:MAG: DMT family transporter [Kiloniellales bacterium]|nr:DMT family transporter [Kiloniellales bacterium]
MTAFSGHAKGVLVTSVGVILLTPDSLLIRLIEADTWTIIFWRNLLLACTLLIGLALAHRDSLFARIRAIGLSGLAAAGLFTCSTISFITAILHTSVANTLIMVSAAPLFAALFSRLFLGEAVAQRTWIAIALTLGGIGVIVSGSLASGSLTGDLAALLTAASIGGTFTAVRSRPRVDMTPAIALGALFSAVIVSPLAVPVAVAPLDLGLLAVMGILLLPLSYLLITMGPRYLPAPEVGLLMLLETVLGPLWVWLVLGEVPTHFAFIGGAIVLGTLIAHSAVGLRSARYA